MATNESRHQKQRVKKHRKDQARKKTRAQRAWPGARGAEKIVRQARDLPIYECLINPHWKDNGLAKIVIARRQPDGNIVFGAYLVDVFCLGLKCTFCNANFSQTKYTSKLHRGMYGDKGPVKCPVALAHRIIYGGIDFATRFGFRPDSDFKLSQYVLEDRESIEPAEDVEFGKDGRPFFVSGPNDDVERIIAQLDAQVGPGNYNYLYGGPA